VCRTRSDDFVTANRTSRCSGHVESKKILQHRMMRPTGDGARNLRSPDQRIRPSSAERCEKREEREQPHISRSAIARDMGDQT